MEKGKRKWNGEEEEDGGDGVHKKGRKTEEAVEEEVEEFFAILRRMKVAVKYLEKSGGQGWRSAVEAEVVVAAEEEDRDKEPKIEKGGEGVEETGAEPEDLLDLNKIPQPEENS